MPAHTYFFILYFFLLLVTIILSSFSGAFVVRIFSLTPIIVEEAPVLLSQIVTGEWRKHGDTDTTGGSLVIGGIDGEKKRDNPKWCQNPQYHIKVDDLESLDDLHIKIILRRKDKPVNEHHTSMIGGHSRQSHAGTTGVSGEVIIPGIGMVVCKATTNEDPTKKIIKKKNVRTNALGEVAIFKCILD